MIGNFDNGSIIGLSDRGEQAIKKWEKSDDLNEVKNSSDEERLLYDSLIQQGYFKCECQDGLNTAYFHINNDCNLNCLGCYSQDSTRNSSKILSLQELFLALRKLKELNLENIIISGGEPFLRKDIYEIFQYMKETLQIPIVQVATNGTLSERYISEELKKYVDEVNISIDGYDKENPTFIRDAGIFDAVIQNAKKLKNAGVNVKLLATLHKKNIDEIDGYLRLSQTLNIPINFSILTCAGDFDDFENWLPVSEQLIKFGCGGLKGLESLYNKASATDFIVVAKKSCGIGKAMISVASDGTIYPCHMIHLPEVALGNILVDTNSEITEACEQFRKAIDVDNIPTCISCEYKYVCGGGCRAHSYAVNKDFLGEDGYCMMNKAYYDVIFDKLLYEIEDSNSV